MCAGARDSRAQEAAAFYGRPVVDIRFEVDGRVEPSAALSRVVDLRVGEPLDRERVRSSMDRLNALEKYEGITPVVVDTPAGVVVTFRLVPRYPVNRVEIVSGDTGVSPGALRAEVRQRFTGTSAGMQSGGVRLSAVEDAVRRFLNDSGYLGADASVTTVVESEAGRATLMVTPHAGPLALIGHSTVQGNSVISSADVLRRTQAQPGQPFRRRQIETRLTEIEDDLRTRGYYEAQTSLQFTQTGPTSVDIVIRVETGPRVELRVEPESALPDRVDNLIPIRRLRSADQDLLEDSKYAIERALRRQGYANASATFDRAVSPDGRSVVITFRITRGLKYLVDHVELPATTAIPAVTLRGLIGVTVGDVFDQERFEAGLARAIDAYRRLGYYESNSRPERETVSGRTTDTQAWVTLFPNITEGVRGQIADVPIAFTGAHQVPDADLRQVMRSRAGAPYIESDAVLDQAQLLGLYRRRGFLSATVTLERRFVDGGAGVVLAVTVNEGPQVLVGRITVLNNERVSEQQILEVAGLTQGEPLGSSTLVAAQQRLLSTTSFRRVSVTQDRLGDETEAQVLITVEEAPTFTGGFGGGLEAGSAVRNIPDGSEDYLRLSPRGFFEIGRRNLGGRNRSVNFFSRVSLKPRSTPEDPERDGRGFGFAEYRATLTYRERRVFKTDTDLLLGLTSEQGSRISYSFLRRGVNAELLHRLTPRMNLSGRYRLDRTRLFDERFQLADQPLIDRLFPQVRLSVLGTGVSWDGRNNPVAATRGTYLTADAEVASRSLGSEVGYVKTFFQASTFRSLDDSAKTVLALRGQIGLARGFERQVTTIGDDGLPIVSVVSNLPISERFFAGGGTTVRGFQVDRLGIYEPVCPTPGVVCGVIDPTTGLSIGGNAVIVMNAEARRVVTKLLNRNLALVGFVDSGNVFARTSDVDLSRVRGAVGFGTRYDSPLGPIRLDFGFKLNRLVVATKPESRWEYHLSIGEAF